MSALDPAIEAMTIFREYGLVVCPQAAYTGLLEFRPNEIGLAAR